MKQLKMVVILISFAAAIAGPATAQSVKVNAWEGFYGQIGLGFGTFSPSISNGKPTYPSPYSAVPAVMSTSDVNNINTGLTNLAAGYSFGVNESYVLGLGVSYYPGASASATGGLSVSQATGNPAYNGLNNSTTATYNIKNLYSVVLTPGYAIDKDRLAYAKVGYTGATIGLSSPIIPYNTTNLSGLALGLGYKQMLASSIYAFGELNYASYGNANVSTITTTSGVTFNGVSVKGTGMDFLVGVGYRY